MLQNGLISSSYISTLERLKTDREYANYQFAIRLKDDFYDVSPKYYQDTEVCFQNAVDFFSSVEKVINDISIFSFRVRTGIADGYGDDILETYLSKEHKRRVNEWLAKNNLQS
jgi:hypothetical protein